MTGPVIALCVSFALVGAGIAYLIMKARILKMQQRFRDSALLLVGADQPRRPKQRKIFKQQMTIEQRTAELRAQLEMQ